MCQPEAESLWLAAYILIVQFFCIPIFSNTLEVMVRIFLALQRKLLSVGNSQCFSMVA